MVNTTLKSVLSRVMIHQELFASVVIMMVDTLVTDFSAGQRKSVDAGLDNTRTAVKLALITLAIC